MAKAPAVETKELVDHVPSNALIDTQDWGDEAGVGQDQIAHSDVAIPRMKLAQAMSPEVKDDKLFNEGDIFHSITKEILCPAGQVIRVVPVAYNKEYILWRDRKTGGGILARASRVLFDGRFRFKWDKENTTFEDKIDGKRAVTYKTRTFIDEDNLHQWGTHEPGVPDSQPAATETHNFLFLMIDRGMEPIAASFSRTQTGKAKELNHLLKMGNAPLYARIINCGSYMDKRSEITFANFGFRPAGFLQRGSEQVKQSRAMYEAFLDKTFNVDIENPQPDTKTEDGKF